jgi:arylsulfatase A-like enzyme
MTRLAFRHRLATCVLALVPCAVSHAQGNVLFIVADDLGVGEVGAYGIGSDAPPTPTLDLMAANGVRFTNAWVSPLCSPTRAQIQTGRLGFRTGVGAVVQPGNPGLPPGEVTLPEMLDRSSAGYAHAAIGKWHLGAGATEAPNPAGYSYYAGVNGSTSLTQTYYDWRGEINGVPLSGTQYLTTREAEDAGTWIESAPEPWFVHLAFHAPHDPLEAPPAELHSFALPPGPPTTKAEKRLVYKAMVEAMDTELGNLLARIAPKLANTTVVFIGDNGTVAHWNAPPYAANQGKATMFQAGVNVPLIAMGPGVARGAVSEALVHAVDLFATLADLSGVDLAAEFPGVVFDGQSLRPYFANPALRSRRDLLHAEYFGPIGSAPPYVFHHRAIRDRRYKLAIYNGQELFFDLRFDPFETNNLAGGALTLKQQLAYQLLSAKIDLPGTWDPYTPKLPPPFPK